MSNPAEEILTMMTNDPLRDTTSAELFKACTHLVKRMNETLHAPTRSALRNVISAVAEAERHMDVEDVKRTIADAKKDEQKALRAIRAAEDRLALLTFEVGP